MWEIYVRKVILSSVFVLLIYNVFLKLFIKEDNTGRNIITVLDSQCNCKMTFVMINTQSAFVWLMYKRLHIKLRENLYRLLKILYILHVITIIFTIWSTWKYLKFLRLVNYSSKLDSSESLPLCMPLAWWMLFFL